MWRELEGFANALDRTIGPVVGPMDFEVLGCGAVRLVDGKGPYVLEMDVPGCKAGDVTAGLDGGVLVITATRTKPDGTSLKSYGRYPDRRHHPKLHGATAVGATCVVADGVVTVTLPRAEGISIPVTGA